MTSFGVNSITIILYMFDYNRYSEKSFRLFLEVTGIVVDFSTNTPKVKIIAAEQLKKNL